MMLRPVTNLSFGKSFSIIIRKTATKASRRAPPKANYTVSLAKAEPVRE